MLAPCPSCARHVRVADLRCPFCGAAQPETRAIAPAPAPTQRLSRAAAYAFSATVAAATSTSLVVACSTSSTPLYGAPYVVDGEAGGGNKDGATDADTGASQPLYGAPAYGAQPVDSGEG
jgi:hypothetical protein